MSEPKYKIGDKVWLLSGDTIEERKITGVIELLVYSEKNKSDGYHYCFSMGSSVDAYGWKSERKIFPTKQDLINNL